MAKLRAIAAERDKLRLRLHLRYPGPHKPQPRHTRPHRTPRTWRPVFPFPMVTAAQMVEEYALYFAGSGDLNQTGIGAAEPV